MIKRILRSLAIGCACAAGAACITYGGPRALQIATVLVCFGVGFIFDICRLPETDDEL